jgi:hypoxanthine phosphoribosyltransferase
MQTMVAMDVGKYSGKTLTEVITEASINKRIEELAAKISTDYQGKTPIIIGVLNGSVFFLSDLVRKLSIPCEIDFIKVSSYYGDTKSSGTVRLIKDVSCLINGKDIIIVEDIIDSGLTAKFLKHRFEQNEPASLEFVSLLTKPEVMSLNWSPKYVGFEMDSQFLVGYGLDIDQKLRNLPSIWALQD